MRALMIWGLGFDIAEKMGLLAALMKVGYFVEDVKLAEAAIGRGLRDELVLPDYAAYLA